MELESRWFYGYKVWCKKNNVVYEESEDMSLCLHESFLANPLYKATYYLWIAECNGRLGRQMYKFQ
ncbi:hypothetical protein [Nostoc sp. NMS7]|uniref:hypothetical protein n=1 Tax=Nostoc sp. NMS7 TaxID=2815391 RepID=UPI0025D96969|nr:hypothetical protein [Nostoc sp. NMS7]